MPRHFRRLRVEPPRPPPQRVCLKHLLFPPEIVLPQVLFRYTNARAPSNILSSVLACASPKGFHQVCPQSTKRAIQNSDRSIDITIVIYSGINNGENSSDITSKDVTRYPYFPRHGNSWARGRAQKRAHALEEDGVPPGRLQSNVSPMAGLIPTSLLLFTVARGRCHSRFLMPLGSTASVSDTSRPE